MCERERVCVRDIGSVCLCVCVCVCVCMRAHVCLVDVTRQQSTSKGIVSLVGS